MSKAQKEQVLKDLRTRYQYLNIRISLSDCNETLLSSFYNQRAQIEAQISQLTA